MDSQQVCIPPVAALISIEDMVRQETKAMFDEFGRAPKGP